MRAITAEEVEAKQHEEAKKQEEAFRTLETALKKHEEEVTAQLAATVKKYQEEAAATKQQLEATEKQLGAIEAKTKPPTRAQLLAKALKACQKQPKKQRPRCEASAHRKYGARK